MMRMTLVRLPMLIRISLENSYCKALITSFESFSGGDYSGDAYFHHSHNCHVRRPRHFLHCSFNRSKSGRIVFTL